MKLLSIEPTPSPNSMKLNVDEMLPRGKRLTYNVSEAESAPEQLKQLLQIKGVRSVFQTADFIALDRKPNANWSEILTEAREILQAKSDGEQAGNASGATSYGESQVLVQMFRGIPMQVRVRTGDSEFRSAVSPKFGEAVQRAAGSTMIRERMLEEFGVRYGEPEEIAEEIVRELDAAYTQERLESLVEASISLGAGEADNGPRAVVRPAPLNADEVMAQFQSEEWQDRYAALERFSPELDSLSVLETALKDSNTSIRRLAVVYLGDLRSPEAMPLLFTALRDSSASVRRTAGDTLSDLGDSAAIGPMIEALSDRNKLVRWRAARFLYEAGDENAIDALRIAAEDAEFEIKLQAQMALERIERGEEAAGSVWQQMTAARNKEQ